MERCVECNCYIFDSVDHKCPPAWDVRVENHHSADEWGKVYAGNQEAAAIKVAESYDNGDYTLLNGGEITVYVRSLFSGEVKKFLCTGETVPNYIAMEIFQPKREKYE